MSVQNPVLLMELALELHSREFGQYFFELACERDDLVITSATTLPLMMCVMLSIGGSTME